MSIIQENIINYGHGRLYPQYFAVHSTANPGATARNHVNLWSRNYPYAVHLVADWNEAFHTVPYDRLCWQVGNANGLCEGLEICEATNTNDFHRGIHIAIQVIAERLRAHGWNVDRMRSHHWLARAYGGSDHSDPIGYFQRYGYSWEQFINDINNYMRTGELTMTTSTDVWIHPIGERGDGNTNNVPAWIRLSWIDWNSTQLRDELLRHDDGHQGDGSSAGIYDRICYIDSQVRGLKKELAGLHSKLDKILTLLDSRATVSTGVSSDSASQFVDDIVGQLSKLSVTLNIERD